MASVAPRVVGKESPLRHSPVRGMARANYDGNPLLHGSSVPKLWSEAAFAWNRFALASFFVHNLIVIKNSNVKWISVEQARGLFHVYAAQQGEDVAALLHGAAKHFEADTLHRRGDALTASEVENLIEDDLRAHHR
jgi:hypothetical protein